MEFLAACCRPGEQDTVSVLLQQYQYRREQIVFACISGGGEDGGRAGGYMTERCLTWFRGLNLKKICRNREAEIERLSKELIHMVSMADGELKEGGVTEGENVNLAAVLCIEEVYVMLCRGAMGIFILNTAFGRAYLRRLEGTREREGIWEGQGRLQPDIGILLAGEGFYGSVGEEVIKESLFVREITSERQMEKRLMELGREGIRRGGTDAGAILIRTLG